MCECKSGRPGGRERGECQMVHSLFSRAKNKFFKMSFQCCFYSNIAALRTTRQMKPGNDLQVSQDQQRWVSLQLMSGMLSHSQWKFGIGANPRPPWFPNPRPLPPWFPNPRPLPPWFPNPRPLPLWCPNPPRPLAGPPRAAHWCRNAERCCSP